MSSSQRPKVLIITGPTAVGKSSTALKLCNHLGGEIISADSVQVFKHLNIGSNKATISEQQQIPHHLVDILDPSIDDFTAGDFFRASREAISDVISRDKVPVVVGGTMMYVRWLMYGRPATPPADETTKERVKERLQTLNGDWQAALALLTEKDPKRAAQLSRNDWYRLGRALEVCEMSGSGVSELPLQGAAPRAMQNTQLDYDFRCVFLHDDRVELSRRIDERCERMILPEKYDEVGIGGSILEEVSNLLLSSGLRIAAAAPSRAIGYRQTISYLVSRAIWWQENESENSEVATEAFRAYLHDFMSATRGYAKQQLAWFRKEPRFQWVQSREGAVEEISNMLNRTEQEYEYFRTDMAEEQQKVREDMMLQGKNMKTYIPKKRWLEEDSMMEKQAIAIGEVCAQRMAHRLDQEELQRVLNFVDK